jgi:hypothetical protein
MITDQRRKALTTESKKIHRELHTFEELFPNSAALTQTAHTTTHRSLISLGIYEHIHKLNEEELQ